MILWELRIRRQSVQYAGKLHNRLDVFRKTDRQRRIGFPEVITMLISVWLMLSSLLYALQLSSGSFPRPLTEEEERYYLKLAAQGDLEARNILVERNLRLVAHIMNKG